MISSSVPAERVLRGDWRRDDRRPSRIVHPTPAAALAVPPTSDAPVRGDLPAEQCTTHQRRAAGGAAHLRRHVADGARSAVRLLLLLVPPGKQEHGSAVGTADADRADGNSRRGSHLGRAFLRTGVGERIAVVVVVCCRSGTRGRTAGSGRTFVSRVRPDDDADRRVDLLGQVVDQRLRIGVEARGGDRDI